MNAFHAVILQIISSFSSLLKVLFIVSKRLHYCCYARVLQLIKIIIFHDFVCVLHINSFTSSFKKNTKSLL